MSTDTETATRPRGPFARVRNLLAWAFWLGLIAAAGIGATGGPEMTAAGGALKVALAYLVAIGIWLLIAGGALWLVDKALVYVRHG